MSLDGCIGYNINFYKDYQLIFGIYVIDLGDVNINSQLLQIQVVSKIYIHEMLLHYSLLFLILLIILSLIPSPYHPTTYHPIAPNPLLQLLPSTRSGNAYERFF